MTEGIPSAVEIETEWNLEPFIADDVFQKTLVEIETEWNLEKEECPVYFATNS